MTDSRSPWAGTSPVASPAHADGTVTLVEGQTFALSHGGGDMAPELPHGLFVLDTRVLSRWELRINGHPLEPLTVEMDEPFAATFVGRAPPSPGRADGHLVGFRHRHIGTGMRERIVLTNHSLEPTPVQVDLTCEVDFAGLFDVKAGRVEPRGERWLEVRPGRLRFGHRTWEVAKDVTIVPSEVPRTDAGCMTWDTLLAPGATWQVCLEVTVALDGEALEARFTCLGDDGDAVPTRRLQEWRARLPKVSTDHDGLATAVERSGADLGALRIFDPEHPTLPILAAGAPWFMTVFGRDSLLTAWMTLLADPTIARGVLETLARFQGEDVDPDTEEEPGKILHEMRFGAASHLSLGGGHVYYGTVDATPLFVMLLGELRRWDPTTGIVDSLLPHADRALAWIEEFGDRDGDGYVEYECPTDHGLVNQGWKDSWDAISSRDGRLAQPPIALCEVQGYVFAAYVARAHFAREAGDTDTYERYAAKARRLRDRFNEDFWLEQHGTYAVGLDGDKRPIDAVASNVGHCLWAGIVDPERAKMVADRLLSEQMFSGFGVRTLSTAMARYNPVSYHNGSVWPHDNALCAAGLARYGFVEHAHRIITAQLDVAAAGAGTLPELFGGFARDELAVPAPYPTSCRPQAWAAASPLLWLRTLLRLDPWATQGEVWCHPELPPSIGRLHVEGIRIAGHLLTVRAESGDVDVEGAGDLRIIPEPRPPLTAALLPREADPPTR
jgi:glycogen debranching enzyme